MNGLLIALWIGSSANLYGNAPAERYELLYSPGEGLVERYRSRDGIDEEEHNYSTGERTRRWNWGDDLPTGAYGYEREGW